MSSLGSCLEVLKGEKCFSSFVFALETYFLLLGSKNPLLWERSSLEDTALSDSIPLYAFNFYFFAAKYFIYSSRKPSMSSSKFGISSIECFLFWLPCFGADFLPIALDVFFDGAYKLSDSSSSSSSSATLDPNPDDSIFLPLFECTSFSYFTKTSKHEF